MFLLRPRAGAGILFTSATAAAKIVAEGSRDPYFDVALESELRARLGDGAWATVSLDAGYARGVVATADARAVARPEGPFLGLRLGLAFSQ